MTDPETPKRIAEKITDGLEEYLQKVAESKGIKSDKKKDKDSKKEDKKKKK